MRVVIPLPFGEIAIDLRRRRRAWPMLWYGVLSAALHFIAISLFAALLFRTIVPLARPQQPPVMVSLSSAMRIAPKAHPVPAHHPLERARPHVLPHPQPRPRPQPRTLARAQPAIKHVAAATPLPSPHPNPNPRAHAEKLTPALTQAQLDAQERAFQRTIAQMRAATDPVAGAATAVATPQAQRRSALNLQGDTDKQRAEGVLYPLKRWIDGPWVYYYVRYDAQYADGSTESGLVPWPIRFPANADPFARTPQHMPLPGPPSGYVLPAGTDLAPLVKNCYDHHYEYCPIERER